MIFNELSNIASTLVLLHSLHHGIANRRIVCFDEGWVDIILIPPLVMARPIPFPSDAVLDHFSVPSTEAAYMYTAA